MYLCSPIYMDKLREKFEINEAAAELLIRESLYAPAVHCSYYSCFQLMKYTLKNALRISYKRQDREIKEANNKVGSHQYVINRISRELKNLVEKREVRDFRRKVSDLKERRIESDYRNIGIDTEKGERALRQAREIKRYLIEAFKL